MRIGNKELTRREFCKAFLFGMAYLAYESLSFKVSLEKSKHLSIFHHVIHIPGLDQKWDRTYLIQFSDTHLSSRGIDLVDPGVMRDFSLSIAGYLKYLGAKQEKTILFDTGDMVSAHMGNNQPTPLSAVEESLSYVNGIPVLAKFSVEGNHEVHHPNFNGIARLLEQYDFFRLGLLNQQKYLINSEYLPFTLVGLPDYTTRKESWYETQAFQQFLEELKTRDPNKPMVLLSHTSMIDSFREGMLQNILSNTLLLHGHTHGGQIAGNTPIGYVSGRYAVYGDWTLRDNPDGIKLIHKGPLQDSKYYKGIHSVGNGNIVSISPGLGHSGLHGPRLVTPGAVIYEIRTS